MRFTVWSPKATRTPSWLSTSTYTGIVGYIGNYTAQMGGVDVITFTAGVGENDDVVRKMVCDKLAPFGVKLDEEKNSHPFQGIRAHLHPGFQDHHLRHSDQRGAGNRPQVRGNRRSRRRHLRQRLLQVSEEIPQSND